MKRELFGFVEKPWFRRAEKLLAVFANIAVVLGVIFALDAIRRSNQSEMRRTAIEAISQTRSLDFLKAYARLKTSAQSGQTADMASTIEDVNYVVNVYDNIAVLTVNALADLCIVKQSISSSLDEVRGILDRLSYPLDYRRNLDAAARLMDRQSCGP